MRRKADWFPTESLFFFGGLILMLSSTGLAMGPAADEAPNMHSVYLRADGNLSGRVCTMDPTGTARPARVSVTLVQAGQPIASARSDAWGRFQIVAGSTAPGGAANQEKATGLKPGVYSVVADGEDGFAAFAVRVLPYRPDASRGQMTLEISLVPVSEKKMLGSQSEFNQGPLRGETPLAIHNSSSR